MTAQWVAWECGYKPPGATVPCEKKSSRSLTLFTSAHQPRTIAPPGVTAGPDAKASVAMCSPRVYWVNIRVHGMTCSQAQRLHGKKLRYCSNSSQVSRRVTRTAYVYTCYFGPWLSIERVGKDTGGDSIYIRRDHGRIWLRYDAVP